MKNRMAIVLAAGKGTRMKSNLHKVLHSVNGLTMIEHVIRAIQACEITQIVTIVGYQADAVKAVVGDRSEYALQAEQLGTGHAVQQAEAVIGQMEGSTLVVNGDTPLIQPDTLQALFDYHEQTGAKATLLTAMAKNPTGYGRIIRQADGTVSHIVEEKDATAEEKAIHEVNTGFYIFDNAALFAALKKVDNHNAQGEYYLPDVIKILKADQEVVSAYLLEEMTETLGINDRIALAQACRLLRQRINEGHMANGVTMVDPERTFIEVDVTIGVDTIIEGGVMIKGRTSIGPGSFIGAGTEIVDSQIGEKVVIRQSVIEEAVIGHFSDVGPFAHLRPKAELGEHVHIGNFVEVKKSLIGNYTKAGHLSYVGDAEIGQHVNVGCGTIFVNYDGKHKHRSKIGDHSFIGSGVNIVSPVNIGSRAVLAAGSTITEDVEDEFLGIARARQKNIDNYWTKFENK